MPTGSSRYEAYASSRRLSELGREAYWNELGEMASDGKIDDRIAQKYMRKMERKGPRLTESKAEKYRRMAISKGLRPLADRPPQPEKPPEPPPRRPEWRT